MPRHCSVKGIWPRHQDAELENASECRGIGLGVGLGATGQYLKNPESDSDSEPPT